MFKKALQIDPQLVQNYELSAKSDEAAGNKLLADWNRQVINFIKSLEP